MRVVPDPNDLLLEHLTPNVLGLLKAWAAEGWDQHSNVRPVLADALEEVGYADRATLMALRLPKCDIYTGDFEELVRGVPLQLQGTSSDWKYAFAYAGEPDAGDGEATIRRAEPRDETTSLAPFSRADVEEVLALSEGENDGPNWLCFGKLRDGRYFFLSAGYDYTGWG